MLAIGDFKNGRVVICDPKRGRLVSAVTLESAPSLSVQGVAWDTSRSAWWVCHRANGPMGSLRRYSTSGALQQTFSLSAISTDGPNGCVYDAANDRILIACGDNRIRGIDCADGSVDENLLLDSTVVGSGVADGLTLDPSEPTTRIWVSVDAPRRRIVKVNRSTGVAVASCFFQDEAEDLAWLNGRLYVCSDQNKFESLGSGSNVPNGNRVHWIYPESPGTHTLPVGGYSVG